MPLIACPDCGRQISDAAPVCIGCGRPMDGRGARGAPAAVHAIPASVPRSGYGCPKCGGELVTFRALHETAGADAPALVAPPNRAAMAPMSPAGCTYALVGAFGVAAAAWYYGNLLWALVAFFVSLKLFGRAARMQARPELDRRFAESMERWERRHLCARCGAQVVRRESGALEAEDADAEIDALIRAGQKIEAIKRVRDRTGLGLKEAKDVVDGREREL